MQVLIKITGERIEFLRDLPFEIIGAVGAVVEFQGVVRDTENGLPIPALDYEAYSPMAEKLMRDIAEELAHRHGCLLFRAVHRVGVVPAGEAAVHLLAAAPHRAQAFSALTEFMDRLKQDVPIWKRPAFANPT